MKTIRTIEEMKTVAGVMKSREQTVGLVPTMGYLHAGHLSLVKESLKKTDITVVSVFVNPTQFGPSEDFLEYPRDMSRDSEILKNMGIDYLFCPDNKEMYPSDYHTFVEVHNLQNKLCGQSRPDHFRGVCTVVLKLFNIIQPDFAFFGQKDAQQVVILTKMIRDLNGDVNIIALPIVREQDGLALSSRNVYLNPEQRQAALCLYKSLQQAMLMIDSGERRSAPILLKMKEIIRAEPEAHIDYLTIVHKASLEPMDEISHDSLIALAAYFGKVRLIDNLWIENLPAFRIDKQ